MPGMMSGKRFVFHLIGATLGLAVAVGIVLLIKALSGFSHGVLSFVLGWAGGMFGFLAGGIVHYDTR